MYMYNTYEAEVNLMYVLFVHTVQGIPESLPVGLFQRVEENGVADGK